MSGSRRRTYRFATGAQWGRCLLHRFDVGDDGALAPMTRLGAGPVMEAAAGPVTAVAVGPVGEPCWRVGAALYVRDDAGHAVAFEVDEALAASPRWVIDRRALWAFAPAPAQVRRYDRETLQSDLTVALDTVVPDDEPAPPLQIVDATTDGSDGLWLLVRAAGGEPWLVQLGCDGGIRACQHVPAAAGVPRALAAAERGATLVLVAADGRTLVFVRAQDGTVARALQLDSVAPGLVATRIAADARNRLVVVGSVPAGGSTPVLVVLDGAGDALDVFPDGAAARAPDTVLDVAVHGDTLWLATTGGLRRLDTGEACGPRESRSVLLTPALLSAASASDRGWLRAEVDVVLPRGVVLQAEYASTNDDGDAAGLVRAASDASRTVEARQEAIWGALDHGGSGDARRILFTGPGVPDVPLAIPLFDCQDRWLWLRLTLVTPPGTPPPALRALRVVHPEVSLMEQVPAIHRGRGGDGRGDDLRRLVGVLETTTQGIDDTIAGIGRHLDPAAAPPAWLDALGDLLGLPWDEALPEAAKRRLLAEAASLLAARGTRRGLERLLRSVFGKDASIAIDDVAADHPPLRLSGGGRSGRALPALLAGTSRRVPTLGARAVLGCARLPFPDTTCNPLHALVPTVRIVLGVDRDTQRAVAPLLDALVAAFVPLGVAVAIRWQVRATGADELDADGPGALGQDSILGNTVVAGRTNVIDASGLDVGFRLT